MNLEARFRPIDKWPGEPTAPEDQRYSPFKATEASTWRLLKRELAMLGSENIVIQAYLRENQIRIDGWPKNGARPSSPGVVVAFDSKFGPLKYATDTFNHYLANLRAIALGLEALRKVDRYGITKRGEQYTGWKQIESGSAATDLRRGRELISEHGGVKAALKAAHPDAGGDEADFKAIGVAAEADGG